MDIVSIFKKFPSETDCIVYLEKLRWGDEPVCPYCGSFHNKRYPRDIHRHFCNDCKTSFSVTVGTIFHRTHLPLQKWFVALSVVLSAKKGISALQLSRDIKVNKNTAWRIYMQLRKAMYQDAELFKGIVEMDETYLGGRPRKNNDRQIKRKRTRHSKNKIPVVGMVQRGGKVSAQAWRVVRANMIKDFLEQKTDIKNIKLMTDESHLYTRLNLVANHETIQHFKHFVKGEVHTNNIESFWAMLKRSIYGQYHTVSKRYLQLYVNEVCYKYNCRLQKNSWELTLRRCLRIT